MTQADPTKFLNHPQSALNEAEVLFLSLPYEATVSYMKGTALGPAAILAASHQLEDMEEETGRSPTLDLKIHALLPLEHNVGEATASYISRVEAAARVRPEAFLVALGGEHSVTPPLVRARMTPGDTVVVIDAHPDLRESYEGDKLSHASAMRRVVENGFKVVQIATGCDTPEEREFIAGRKDFTRFWARECATREGFADLLACLQALSGRVWFSVDLDGLCTSIMPGVGTPIPGGLGWHRTVDVVRALFMNPRVKVAGMDVVELRPLPESELSEFTAAKLIQKCLGMRSGGGSLSNSRARA